MQSADQSSGDACGGSHTQRPSGPPGVSHPADDRCADGSAAQRNSQSNGHHASPHERIRGQLRQTVRSVGEGQRGHAGQSQSCAVRCIQVPTYPATLAFTIRLRRAFPAIKASLEASGAEFRSCGMQTFYNCKTHNFKGSFNDQLGGLIEAKSDS
jgi:hypothetical protein